MRFYEKVSLKISEDLSTDPKRIKFAEDLEDIDADNLEEIVSRYESFPVGVHAIPLGNITTPKLLIIKPTADLSVTIDGTAYTFKGGKLSKLWVEFSTLSLTVTTAANVVSLVVAGE